MTNKHALVIGASGGIAQAVINTLIESAEYSKIFTVSRGNVTFDEHTVVHTTLDSSDEKAVQDFLKQLKQDSIALDTVICCVGVLHNEKNMKPEKRLEDISSDQLKQYFNVNSIIPAIWLKHLISIMNKDSASISFISARVGSISDNRLGGWYGYRASKAALNMLVKTAGVEYARRAPNTSLLCYHPGTVDTALSKPFQANVKAEKLFTADFTAQQLLDIIRSLNPEKGPQFLDWKGSTITW